MGLFLGRLREAAWPRLDVVRAVGDVVSHGKWLLGDDGHLLVLRRCLLMHVVLARIWLGHVDGSLWHGLSILHHGWLLWDLHRLLWVLLGSGRGIMVFKLVCLLLRRYSWRHHDLLMSWILWRLVLGLHHLVLLITLIHAGCLLSSILGGVLVVNGVVQLLLHLIGMPHLWIR